MEFTIPGNNCQRVIIADKGLIEEYIRFESVRGNVKWFIEDDGGRSYSRLPEQLERLLEKEFKRAYPPIVGFTENDLGYHRARSGK